MNLSSQQRKIVWAGLVCLAVLSVYVPWKHVLSEEGFYKESPAGYSFIFRPPNDSHWGVQIDLVRLLLPMGLVLIATVAAALATGRRPGGGDAPGESGRSGGLPPGDAAPPRSARPGRDRG